ncbi:MAG: dihydrofolate reductase [Ginsengibacter sp.]
MILCHIVAASENNVIGANNELPWKLSTDFRYFKNKTWGMPVIMGRKTFNSLKKDLPGRINIVLTSKKDWNAVNVTVVSEVEDAITQAKESDAKEIFIIGGGQVFKQTMDIVNRIYLTRVHTVVEGDTYYPQINENDWKLVSSIDHSADEKNNYSFTFEVWEKK